MPIFGIEFLERKIAYVEATGPSEAKRVVVGMQRGRMTRRLQVVSERSLGLAPGSTPRVVSGELTPAHGCSVGARLLAARVRQLGRRASGALIREAIVALIAASQDAHQRGPSTTELAHAIGRRCHTTVMAHLRVLREQGVVTWERNYTVAGSLRVLRREAA